MTKKDTIILKNKISDFIDSAHNLRRLITHNANLFTVEYFKFIRNELDDIETLWKEKNPFWK